MTNYVFFLIARITVPLIVCAFLFVFLNTNGLFHPILPIFLFCVAVEDDYLLKLLSCLFYYIVMSCTKIINQEIMGTQNSLKILIQRL